VNRTRLSVSLSRDSLPATPPRIWGRNHYAPDVLTIKELATVDAFLAGKPNVRREKSNTINITGVKARPSTEVVVMNYK
jgi:hypothetical protein